MSELYLDLNEKVLDSIKERLRQTSIDVDPYDKERKENLLIDVQFEADEMDLEETKDRIYFNVPSLKVFGQEIGYLSISLDLNQELAVEIIDRYIKKLNKLKTVLEATK